MDAERDLNGVATNMNPPPTDRREARFQILAVQAMSEGDDAGYQVQKQALAGRF